MDAEQTRRRYVAQLETVIRQMLQPLKGVPFNLAIEAMTGCKVLEFEAGKGEHQGLLDLLDRAATDAGNEINRVGIASRRVNEVGNKIEPFVRDAINRIHGAKANVPTTRDGKRKAAGYPDIEVVANGVACYLECKTFNPDTSDTTQRSFYFSPSDQFKVTRDALHFLLSYEMYAEAGRYKTSRYKLLVIESLSLDVKHEFNSDNKRLYSGKNGTRLLAEKQFA
jgi:hypothetical protein